MPVQARMKQVKRPSLEPLKTGQVWQMEGMQVQISTVGKSLVHYRQYKLKVVGSRLSLAKKVALEKYLLQNNASLVRS